MSVKNDIREGMARAIWVTAYVQFVEGLDDDDKKDYDIAGPGEDWIEVSPETPDAAYKAADDLIAVFDDVNSTSVAGLFANAGNADDSDDLDAEEFGHYLAMEAMGEGVSWFDDHKKFYVAFPFTFEADFDGEELSWSGRSGGGSADKGFGGRGTGKPKGNPSWKKSTEWRAARQNPAKTNREGMTWIEWQRAAGGFRRKSHPVALAAWEAGEDPTEWRAARQNPADDEDDSDQDNEPDEEDLVTSDHYKFYQNHKLVLTVPFEEDWRPRVSAWMEKNNYYPNVWFISDHGNAHLMSLVEQNPAGKRYTAWQRTATGSKKLGGYDSESEATEAARASSSTGRTWVMQAPAKVFASNPARRRNPIDPKTKSPYLGDGYRNKITIVNASDKDWTKHRYVLWFGAYGDTRLLVYANSLDDALDEAIDWIADHAPGLLADEQVKEAYESAMEDARARGVTDESHEYAMDTALMDVTTAGNNSHHINSWEWGILAEDPTREQLLTLADIKIPARSR